MTANEIENLKLNLRSYLESHNINTSKMFRCLNSQHTDNNGSMKYFNDNKVYCFGCGQTYNLFDVISIFENVDKKEAFKRAINYYQNYTQKPKTITLTKPKEIEKKELKDYQKAYKFWKGKLSTEKDAQEYLQSRGISMKTANKFDIGFNEFTFNKVKLKAIIIPITANCFTARNIDKNNLEFRYYKPTGCHTEIFNKSALTNEVPYCVIAEGEFDCLSFEELGFNAISLGGVNNVIKFKELEKDKHKHFILALDNDEAGQQAKNDLIAYFNDNMMKYSTFDNLGYKDPNKALIEDKMRFEKEVKRITQKVIRQNQNEM